MLTITTLITIIKANLGLQNLPIEAKLLSIEMDHFIYAHEKFQFRGEDPIDHIKSCIMFFISYYHKGVF